LKRNHRVVFYDIETAPSLGYYFDLYKEGNIVSTVQSWFMLSFAYKVQGEKKIHYHCLADYPGYNKDKTDDKALVADLHRLVFSSADCLVGHNIDRFDSRKAKARFLAHGLAPPPPVKTIDTLKLARRVFKLDSNRLAAVGEYLGLGGKAVTTGWKLWEACIAGDRAAWKQMGIYNKRDVDLLEQVYDRLAPWQPTAPYLGAAGCPSCYSDRVQQRGFNISRSGKRPRFHCQDCSHWFAGKCHEKSSKPSTTQAKKIATLQRRGG
jgi:uncharacterized protein YprB with RNaseH-like and TPR domain